MIFFLKIDVLIIIGIQMVIHQKICTGESIFIHVPDILFLMI